jgi:reactive intermediate/imine deaminase
MKKRFSSLKKGTFIFLLALGTLPVFSQSGSNVLSAKLPTAEAAEVGDLLYISGHVGYDPKTLALVNTDFKGEVKQAMENIGRVLRQHHLSYSDLFDVTIYLTDINRYAETNEVYAQYFTTNYPARVCVAVKQLPLNANIEISAIARLSSMTRSNPLVGSWRLIAADKILPDGREVPDYGSAPSGIAMLTADNHYAVEVYKTERMKFASGDRSKGTPEEYKDAVMGTSCHFGTYSVDVAKGTITYAIDRASFPNYDQSSRTNTFTLKGDTLTWRIPPRPDGSIPVSVFVRIR